MNATHRTLPAPAILRRAAVLAAVLALLALAAAPALAAAGELWIHVRVEEENGATVKLNLPISFVETAVRAVPEATADGRIVIHDQDFDVAELRAMWASLENTGDVVLVEVDEAGETVHVRKAGGYLLVDVDEPAGDTRADVRIPERVVEALLSAGGDELDLSAALRALAEAGEGELVTVNDRNAHVRIWVDAAPAGE